jgi:hypothetical protein
MPTTNAPFRAKAPAAGEQAAVDSGWSSLPPAPAITDEASGVQSLSSKRRAEGTLLGVAPPRSPAALPARRNPVIVHAGLSGGDPRTETPMPVPAGEAALPIPTLTVRALETKADDDGSTNPYPFGQHR